MKPAYLIEIHACLFPKRRIEKKINLIYDMPQLTLEISKHGVEQ